MSTLIHFAVNVRTDGVPVAAAALVDIGVEPRAFAEDVLARAEREEGSLRDARAKIRAKGEA